MDPLSPRLYVVISDTARNRSRSGIQTVVRNLAAAFARIAPKTARLVVWDRKRKFLHLLPPEAEVPDIEPLHERAPLRAKECGRALDAWWRRRSAHLLPLHRHPRHAPHLQGAWLLLPELIYGRNRASSLLAHARAHQMRTAAIFYDAIPVLQPEVVPLTLPALHAEYLAALTGFEKVFAISDSAARDWHTWAAYAGLPDVPITVTHLPSEIRGAPRESSRPRSAGPRARALCVSTLEPRKNHRSLLAALDVLADAKGTLPIDLDLVGETYPGADDLVREVEAATNRFGGSVRWHRSADNGALRALYGACDFTIYPSVVEGFGMPVMESLWLARPCICADFGVMAENAAGGGCLTVDVRDPVALAGAIQRLAHDESLYNRLAEEASSRALGTWDEYAGDLLAALEITPKA